jgi:hypothetical protein
MILLQVPRLGFNSCELSMNGRLERVGKTGECEAGGREDCGTERESDGDVGWKCEK